MSEVLLSAPRHGYGEAEWWDIAVSLYISLAAGNPPTTLPVRSPHGEPVHLDISLGCSSWYGTDVEYNRTEAFAVGPPLIVAAALLGAAGVNRRARLRAEALARPQWRSHGALRVLVTSTATWLVRGTETRVYPHSAMTSFEVAGRGCTIVFSSGDPMRLEGPGMWAYAVMVMYALHGPRMIDVPVLEPVRQAALWRAGLLR